MAYTNVWNRLTLAGRKFFNLSPSIKTIETHLSKLGTPKDAHHCLMLMIADENNTINKTGYKRPYYRWRWQLDNKVQETALNRLDIVYAACTEASDKLTVTALTWRLGGFNHFPLEPIISAFPSTQPDSMDAVLKIELATMLHFRNKWKLLIDYCQQWLSECDFNQREKYILSGFFMQASYEEARVAILENNTSDNSISQLLENFNFSLKYIPNHSANAQLYQSIIDCVQGNIETAIENAAAAKTSRGYLTPFFKAGLHSQTTSEANAILRESSDNTMPWLTEFPTDIRIRHTSKTCVLVSCNQGYFKQYCRGFIQSFAHANPGGTIHIHCINFSPEPDEIASMENDFGVNINYTLDYTDLSSSPADQKLGYYAGARYIHLPKYLEFYERVVVSDLDGVFKLDLSKTLQSPIDVIHLSGIVLEPDRTSFWVPWHVIIAWAFLCSNTPQHKAFCRFLSLFLAKRFHECNSEHDRYFFSDQMGLLLAYQQFKSDIHFKSIDGAFSQSGDTVDASRRASKSEFQKSYMENLQSKSVQPEFVKISDQLERIEKQEDKATVLLLMQAYEATTLQTNGFKRPYYFWKYKLSKPAQNKVVSLLKQIDFATLTPNEQIVHISLLWRLADAQALPDCCSIARLSDQCSDIETDLLIELATICLKENDWQSLTVTCKHAISKRDIGERTRICMTALLMQAIYVELRPRIFQNTLTDRDFAKLESTLAFCLENVPLNSANASLYESVVVAAKGDLDHAMEIASRAKQSDGYLTPFFKAGLHALSKAEMDQKKTQVQSTSSNWLNDFPVEMIINTQTDKAVLISCDEAYFKNYFEGFVQSFALANTGKTIHLHCINFRPEPTHIAKMGKKLDISINYSFDSTDLSGCSAEHKMGYYAGARYIHLPTYLQHYNEIIVCDIDGVFKTQLEKIWAKSDAPILISSRIAVPNHKYFFALWQNIGAGAFAIRATEESNKAANFLSSFLADQFSLSQNGEMRYFSSDQMGLLAMVLAYREEMDIGFMPDTFEQSEDNIESSRGQSKAEFQKEYIAKN